MWQHYKKSGVLQLILCKVPLQKKIWFQSKEHAAWRISETLDCAMKWLTQTGGLFVAHKSTMRVLWTRSTVYSNSGERSFKGVFATLFNWGMDYRLLVFTTHLDGNNIEFQPLQVQQLIDFIRSSVETVIALGNVASKIACIVTGDFNIAANSQLYMDCLRSPLDWRDLAECSHSAAPTYGRETGNTLSMWGGKERLDYIFAVDSISTDIKFAKVKCERVLVLKQEPGQELSDHWGICASIAIDDK